MAGVAPPVVENLGIRHESASQSAPPPRCQPMFSPPAPRLWRVVTIIAFVAAACGDDHPREPSEPPAPLPPGEIRVTSLGTTTTEAGDAVTIEIALTAPPTASVTIGVSVDDPSEAAASSEAVRFDAGDVEPKLLAIAGVDDDIIDGAQSYNVRFAAAASDDARYAGAIPRAIALTNTDEDVAMGAVQVTLESGRGSGTVTSSPPGITCPGTCTASFPVGAQVTLSQSVDPGSRFGGWRVGSVDAPSFEPTVTFQVTAHSRASAHFVLDHFAWFAAVDGASNEIISTSAAARDAVYVGGSFDGPTTIGGEALPHGGGKDALVAARSSVDGAPRWSAGFGGSGDAEVTAIAVLRGGDVVVGGTFGGELELAGTVIPSTGPATRSFVARLAAADGSVQWARVMTAGPTQRLAALNAAPDGGFIACGAGAAPVATFDAAGQLVATATPFLLESCRAIDRREGGWIAAGLSDNSDHSGAVIVASFDEDLAVRVDETPFVSTGDFYDIVDLTAIPDGAVFVFERTVIGDSTDTWLVRVDGTGITQTAVEIPNGRFSDPIAMVRRGDHLLLVHRESKLLAPLVIEHRDLTTLLPITSEEFDPVSLRQPDLVTMGDRCFLVSSGEAPRPLPGWPLSIDQRGGYVVELELQPESRSRKATSDPAR